uniref:Uncharacterized protein n=1 Tax=Romanomermis culicivorax TaxID=13658 RepID=A0A915KRC6_ROMCU
MGWHWHGKLEIFHIRGHDRLGVEANQCIAMEIWRGLGGPQKSTSHRAAKILGTALDIPTLQIGSADESLDVVL